VGLGQVGEFSYVLGALALSAGLISKQVSAGLIGAVVVSIAASSVLVRIKPPVRKVVAAKGMTQ
jgi:predicted Kef-type K+ transport protein